jgi:EAL domain-containing protein (putative c-di-GMP-specific phosphodiesterase class I)
VKDLLDTILEPGGLTVHFQPIMELREEGRRLYGLECLIRGPNGTNL